MKIIAHRGASGYCPENTLPSFEKAIQMGAEAIELDVQLTRDNEVVVFHDYTLERTTNGKGMIMTSDLQYLKSLDAGSWYGKQFENTRISTLKEVLERIPETVTVNIELKKLGIDERPFADIVYGIVKDMNRLDSVIFSSFNHYLLRELHELGATDLEMLLRSDIIEPWKYIERTGMDIKSVNLSLANISKDIVMEIHKHGYMVKCDTVNDILYARLLENAGVDAIFTNYPDIMKVK